MKNIFIMIIFLFLASCSSDEESVSFEDKYQGWVSRAGFDGVTAGWKIDDVGNFYLKSASGVYGFRYFGADAEGFGEGDLIIGAVGGSYIFWDQSAGDFSIQTAGQFTLLGGGDLILQGSGDVANAAVLKWQGGSHSVRSYMTTDNDDFFIEPDDTSGVVDLHLGKNSNRFQTIWGFAVDQVFLQSGDQEINYPWAYMNLLSTEGKARAILSATYNSIPFNTAKLELISGDTSIPTYYCGIKMKGALIDDGNGFNAARIYRAYYTGTGGPDAELQIQVPFAPKYFKAYRDSSSATPVEGHSALWVERSYYMPAGYAVYYNGSSTTWQADEVWFTTAVEPAWSTVTVGGRFSNVEGYRYYCVIYG